MQTRLAGKLSFAAFLFSIFVFIVGCKSTPPVDWSSRVGTYTYDQAVIELGPPDKQAKLDDGKTVAEWVTHRSSGGSGLSLGTGLFSGGGGSGVGVGVGQSIGSSNSEKVLKLVFDTDNKLASWSR